MKKILVLLIALLTIVGCSKSVDTDKPAPDIAKEGFKLGLASSTSYEDTEGEELSHKVDVTIAAVLIDHDGKIKDVKIDAVKADVKQTSELAGIEIKSKKELGTEYNMISASKIGKEWFEQIESLEKAFVGKTLEEMKKFESAADLTSSVSININGYKEVVIKAMENAHKVDFQGVLGLGVTTLADAKSDSSSIVATFAATLKDNEGKLISSVIDVSQNKTKIENGKLLRDGNQEAKTKLELGKDYGMASASKIGKEWNEQIVSYQETIVGKTIEQIKNNNEDISSTVTIKTNSYVEVLEKAMS